MPGQKLHDSPVSQRQPLADGRVVEFLTWHRIPRLRLSYRPLAKYSRSSVNVSRRPGNCSPSAGSGAATSSTQRRRDGGTCAPVHSTCTTTPLCGAHTTWNSVLGNDPRGLTLSVVAERLPRPAGPPRQVAEVGPGEEQELVVAPRPLADELDEEARCVLASRAHQPRVAQRTRAQLDLAQREVAADRVAHREQARPRLDEHGPATDEQRGERGGQQQDARVDAAVRKVGQVEERQADQEQSADEARRAGERRTRPRAGHWPDGAQPAEQTLALFGPHRPRFARGVVCGRLAVHVALVVGPSRGRSGAQAGGRVARTRT